MYNTGKRVSVKVVFEKIYRDYGFNTEIVWADVIEWIAEAINLLGVAPAYEDKVSDKLKLDNGRVELPCDVMYIKMVRDFVTKENLVRSFDQFHLSNFFRCPEEMVSKCQDEYCYPLLRTYTVNNNFLFTNAIDGDRGTSDYIEIAYKAMPTDEEGLPLIPDDTKYIRAMSTYVAEKLATKLFYQDKFSENKLQRIERDRDWAFGSAKMKMIIPDIDQMESWKNSFLRLIPTINSHNTSFKYDAQPQHQRNHNSY